FIRRNIFMRRLGRLVVLASSLFLAAFLAAHSFLVVTAGGLVTGVRVPRAAAARGARVGGQARPGSSASTNGTRGARPYTTWTAYSGGAHSSQYSALDQINRSN